MHAAVKAPRGEYMIQLQPGRGRRPAWIVRRNIPRVLRQVIGWGVGMLSTGILRTNLLKSETVHTVENGVGTRRKNLRPLTEVIVHIEIASGQDPVRRGVVGTNERRQV